MSLSLTTWISAEYVMSGSSLTHCYNCANARRAWCGYSARLLYVQWRKWIMKHLSKELTPSDRNLFPVYFLKWIVIKVICKYHAFCLEWSWHLIFFIFFFYTNLSYEICQDVRQNVNHHLWWSIYFLSASKFLKPYFQRRRIKIALAMFYMATVHAKNSAKPFHPLAKTTLLQTGSQ